jgi:transposase
VSQASIRAHQQEPHGHADETRWLVFDEIQGKVGYRWYLWGFRSASPVGELLDPSRSATVPPAQLPDAQEGTLSVDRYQAYKTFVKDREGAFQ